MTLRFLSARRLLAAGLVVLSVVGATACSRKDAILDPAVTPPPPGGLVTYRNKVKHLLSDRSESARPIGCTHCHHADSAIPDWSDYQTVVAYAGSIDLVLDVNNPNNRLPIMAEFLLPGEIAIIRQWIANGTPE